MQHKTVPQPGPAIPLGEFLAIDARFPAVYILFNRGQIVYVGQSKTLRWRIETHLNEGVKTFDAVAYAPCSVDQLTHVEGYYIRQYAPKYNVCAIANKARTRAAWRVERNRHQASLRTADPDAPVQFVDASTCTIELRDIGEFLAVSDRDAAEWIKAGKIVDTSVMGLINFVAMNTHTVSKAQVRYEEL